MAGGGEEQLAALVREAEALKQRLEEERQKLNDVTRESCSVLVTNYPLSYNYSKQPAFSVGMSS